MMNHFSATANQFCLLITLVIAKQITAIGKNRKNQKLNNYT